MFAPWPRRLALMATLDPLQVPRVAYLHSELDATRFIFKPDGSLFRSLCDGTQLACRKLAFFAGGSTRRSRPHLGIDDSI